MRRSSSAVMWPMMETCGSLQAAGEFLVRLAAIFLLPIAYPHSALSRNWSLSYQELTIRLATSRTGMRRLALRCRLAARRINGKSRRDLASGLASGRSIRFLTSPQRLLVARADILLPREKRAFFLQRVAFHLRPHGAVAPSDADVEAVVDEVLNLVARAGRGIADTECCTCPAPGTSPVCLQHRVQGRNSRNQ